MCSHIKETHRNVYSLHVLKIKKWNFYFRIAKLFVSYHIIAGGNSSQLPTMDMVILLLHREKHSPIIIYLWMFIAWFYKLCSIPKSILIFTSLRERQKWIVFVSELWKSLCTFLEPCYERGVILFPYYSSYKINN